MEEAVKLAGKILAIDKTNRVARLVEGVHAMPTLRNLAGLGWLCLVGGAMTYALWFRGVRRLAPSVVSSLLFLSPLTAVLLGWSLLGQTLAHSWSLATALSFLVWYIFAPQCASTLAVIRRETGGWIWMWVRVAQSQAMAQQRQRSNGKNG